MLKPRRVITDRHQNGFGQKGLSLRHVRIDKSVLIHLVERPSDRRLVGLIRFHRNEMCVRSAGDQRL
ncbi:hypothetical protein FIU99_26875 (plasmid) [Vibrio sp. THAF64]|nr:hypothetical protein FIU99_26875 [Vibrio sp. THAF64]